MVDRNLSIPVHWRLQQGSYETLDLSTCDAGSDLRKGVSVVVCTYQRALSLKRFLSSLDLQEQAPNSVIIVDASPNEDTEQIIREFVKSDTSYSLYYLRVDGDLRGLTRQRNLALDYVETDLVAFFDDDIVLEPNCLQEMESVIRQREDVVGVGAYIMGDDPRPGLMLIALRWLGAVPDLTPGRYHRSGLVIPIRLIGKRQGIVDVDRLQGCSMLFPTYLARKERFNEFFHGYAQSEDLEFSRRLAKYGRLVISGESHVYHFHDLQGRPDQISLGRMGIVNRYLIHRDLMENRRWKDILWFIYAQFFYVLFSFISLLCHKGIWDGVRYMQGALLGVKGILAKEFDVRWNNS